VRSAHENDHSSGLIVAANFCNGRSKNAARLIDRLGTAIAIGDQKQFTVLLPRIKNIDEELNSTGETALTLAAYNNRFEMVDMLNARELADLLK
jgi:ankyrin repeat protein